MILLTEGEKGILTHHCYNVLECSYLYILFEWQRNCYLVAICNSQDLYMLSTPVKINIYEGLTMRMFRDLQDLYVIHIN